MSCPIITEAKFDHLLKVLSARFLYWENICVSIVNK